MTVPRSHLARRVLGVVLLAGTWAAGFSAGMGCQSRPVRPVQASLEMPQDQLDPYVEEPIFGGLDTPAPLEAVEAVVSPPLGWKPDPLKASDRHNHQAWISPSGNTAYGIIRFKMPLPIGAELALRHGFLPEMKRSEGEARLISSERDPGLPGIRFIAEGGLYRLRTNMITRGWRGWAVYAGTLRKAEIVPDELALAELAREHTTVGLKKR